MVDLKWVVEQHVCLFNDGKITSKQASAAILNAIAMAEADTIDLYQFAKVGIECVCKDEPKACELLCKMIDGLIGDEGDHMASAAKGAAIVSNIKAPKPSEYDEAAKGEKNEQSTI